MILTDAELVNAVRDGRRESYEELVRRYAGKVRAVCWSKLGRNGPIDDMVQEAFMRGYRAIASIENPDRFGGWLYGIAVRACLDWRKAKERSQVSFGSLGADKNPDEFLRGQPRSIPEEDDRHKKILDGVEALPEIYREVVTLFYYQKRSYKEMSSLLGVTPAAINARLTKARTMLRDAMARTVKP